MFLITMEVMKNSILLFSILLMFAFVQAFSMSTNTGIAYKHISWEDVLMQAKENHQPIFVKTYASYCMPCKMMDSDVYPDPEVSSIFNSNFINFKVDMQTKLGSIFNLAYNVSAIPDLLFFNPEGDVILRATGGKSKNEIIDLAHEALNIMNGTPVDNISNFVVSSETFTNSETFVISEPFVLNNNQTANLSFSNSTDGLTSISPNHDYAANFVNTNSTIKQKNKQITHDVSDFSPVQLPSINQFSTETQRLLSASSDPFSDEMFTILRNKKNLYKEMGKVEVDKHIKEVVTGMVFQGVSDKNINLLEKAISILHKSDLDDKASIELNLSLNYYSETGNWVAFSKIVKNDLVRSKRLNPDNVLSATKKIISSSNDLKSLKMAAKWMKKITKIYPTYKSNIVYSKVLIQLKKYDQALKIAKKANDIACLEEKGKEECQLLMREIEYIR